MTHRGVDIFLREGICMPFISRDGMRDYHVRGREGLAFGAFSKFGESWAMAPEQALQGAKTLIDRGLDG